MGKRGGLGKGLAIVMAMVFSVLFSAIVYAEHTATVSLSPLQIYETNTGLFNMLVTNTKSNDLLLFDIFWDDSKSSIKNVSINYAGFTFLASTIPSDWARSLASDVLAYSSNYSGISSGGSLVFNIRASASKVDQNTTQTWTIITKDINNDMATNIVQILVVNDDTPPILTNPLPYDGMYIKEGTNNQETRINAIDPETGVKQVNFNYDDCAYLNETKNVVLGNNADLYSGTVDLSPYDDSTSICFSFNAENNGGEMGVYSGRLTIDGQAPEVELISPADNALMNSQSDFEFVARDNLSPNMTCELLVDGVSMASQVVENNVTSTFSVEVAAEGQHKWSVSCSDLAGWTTPSETRSYVLDRTAPNARIVSPLSSIMREGTNVSFIVTDNFALDGIVYSYSHFNAMNPNYAYVNYTIDKATYTTINESAYVLSTSLWEEGYHDISIWADDTAGNNGTYTFAIIVDNTAPEVDLISPLNESTTDTDFVFNTSDNYDPIIDCTLYVNETASGTTQVNTSETPNGTISAVLAPGTYSWRVECSDDAGNTASSEPWNITIIDTTGPDITFNNVGVVVRGNDIVINATITDISGVNESSVYATIENPENVTVDVIMHRETGTDYYVGDFPTASISPLGNYIARVYAEDNAGNSNSYYAIYGLTYAYVVTLTLAPNPVYTTQQVTASGTVLKDDGTLVTDSAIRLALPESTADAGIDAATGAYSHIFNAPATANNYTITAEITAENGFTFSALSSLEVQTQEDNGGGNGGGGGGGDSTGDDDDNHSPGSCPNCGPCESDDDCGGNKICYSGYCMERECTKESDCGKGKQCNNGRCVGQQLVEDDYYLTKSAGQLYHYCTDGTCDYDESCRNCPEDCGECTTGIGKAGGFLNLSGITSSFLWVILITALVIFGLVYLYQYGNPRMPGSIFGKKDKLKMEDYINRRNQQ